MTSPAHKTTAARTTAETQVVPLRRFGGFEAYRGLAAALIVVFHGYQYTGEPYRVSGPAWADLLLHNLDSLVDMFFVLSAFLLTLPWVRASLDGTPAQSARGYLVRRAIRILPVYWVVILVIWALRNPGLPGNWRDLIEHLTFTQVFDSTRIFFTVGPAWSLADEVMFYLFLLGAGLLMTRLCRRLSSHAARVAAWTTVPVLMIGFTCWWVAWSLYTRHVPETHWSTWFGPAAKAGVFGAGMLLAIIYSALPPGTTVPRPWPAVLRCAGVATTVGLFAWRGPFPNPHEEWVHVPLAFTLALLLAGSAFAPATAPWERLLEGKALVILGVISYSVYLWHEPLLLFLGTHGWVLSKAAASFLPGTAVLLVISLAAGWASYWGIEYPIAAVRARLDRRGHVKSLYGPLEE